ncbi:MAG TPA: TIGR01777 family oxidoreductase [Cytophagaceae bacterium]|jgi:uncharacterized protein (TIGR01777 family)|nr:TIGR01777 family oxidoreductase [Cytophagaceae bacterium]
MRKNILITGGTGLIGSRLAEYLRSSGYNVSILSRHRGDGRITQYRWDYKLGYLDEAAIANADYVIHLAGAGVFDKKWTAEYKKELEESRIATTELLVEKISSVPNTIQAVLCASAIGFYGQDTGDVWQTENSISGKGFLASLTKKWETAADQIEKTGIRTVKIRLGIVLSDKGGALMALAKQVSYWVGAPVGSGLQYVSWIHIDDLCALLLYAIEHEHIKGTYNAVAPEPVSNKTFLKKIASILKKPLWLPNIPPFVLKIILGTEQASIILGGNRVSAKKIIEYGFKFNYPTLPTALTTLLKKDK